MEYFRAEVKVGAFLLVSLALLVLAALVVGDLGRWFVTKHRYTVLLPNANLLRDRAQVSYAGYRVGDVTAIALRSEEARMQQHPEYPVAVTIAVQASVPLREDTRIELRTDGFIGDRYLDISPGTGPPVPPGGTLLGTLGGVEGLLTSFSGVGGGLDDLTRALYVLLADTSQPHSLPATLASLNRLIDTLLPRLTALTTAVDELFQSIKQDVARTSIQAGGALQRIDATVAENRDGLRQLVNELHTSLADARKTVSALRQFLEVSQGDLGKVMGSLRLVSESLQRSAEATAAGLQQLLAHADAVVVQNDRNLYTTVENLRDVTDNLKATSQLLRTNPAVLVWGSRGSNNNTNATNASAGDSQLLRDRGRIGRYDKAP
jgi:phospholipid/cholesterol/gamma-HCH transport system substrate-binding protein